MGGTTKQERRDHAMHVQLAVSAALLIICTTGSLDFPIDSPVTPYLLGLLWFHWIFVTAGVVGSRHVKRVRIAVASFIILVLAQIYVTRLTVLSESLSYTIILPLAFVSYILTLWVSQ